MSITQATINKLYKEQRGGCALCGRLFTHQNPAQCHHAIYGREKQFAKFLDMSENLVLLCADCHSGHGDMSNWFMRCHWWTWKKELGYPMEEWHESIVNKRGEQMIVKDNFLDLRMEG